MPTRNNFDRLRVVLVATRNPLNLGAAARAMSNFGILRLRVVNPYDLAFREARSAVGASELLASAEEFGSVAEAVADCTLVVGTTALSRREPQHPVRELQQGAQIIRKRLTRGRVALLFGSERTGLSNEALSHCHWLMHIPTRGKQPSVNLAQAVAICLYELARDGKLARPADKQKSAASRISPSANSGEVERVTAGLFQALRACGYVQPHSAAPAEEKLRRLIRRLKLSANDADVLVGMLRQIVWKLR